MVTSVKFESKFFEVVLRNVNSQYNNPLNKSLLIFLISISAPIIEKKRTV